MGDEQQKMVRFWRDGEPRDYPLASVRQYVMSQKGWAGATWKRLGRPRAHRVNARLKARAEQLAHRHGAEGLEDCIGIRCEAEMHEGGGWRCQVVAYLVEDTTMRDEDGNVVSDLTF